MPLKTLDHEALENILKRCEGIFGSLNLTQDGRAYLLQLAQGDGRYLLNLVESLSVFSKDREMDVSFLQEHLQKRVPLFDRSSDQHYNLISALHKSVRGSDPDAALYWLARMLEGGEDPRFIARRLIRMAIEDIGLADPQALQLAIAAKDGFEFLGSPEGELGLAQVVIYLALAPKSNAVYTAYKSSRAEAAKTSQFNPPKHILNAPTKLMKEMDYGKGYQYDHETPYGCSGQQYFPEEMNSSKFYHPVERGFEREMKKRLSYFNKLRDKTNN